MQPQGEGSGVESVGGNNGADVALGATTTAAVEITAGTPAATATATAVGAGAPTTEEAARGPESTSDEPPQQSAGAANKGAGQYSDSFGEHGWYSPAGASEVGVG